MKHTIFLLVLLFAINVQAQQYQLGITAQGLASTELKITETENFPTADFERRRLGFMLGLNLQRKINQKVSVSVGLTYVFKSWNNYENLSTFENPEEKKSPYQFKKSIQSIEMPLGVKYFFGNLKNRPKMLFFAGLDLIPSFDFRQNVTLIGIDSQRMYLPKEERSTTFLLKPNFEFASLSPVLSFGAQFKLSDKISLDLQPFYRIDYSVRKKKFSPNVMDPDAFTHDTEFRKNLASWGLKTQLNISL